jgi:hypothetical protein
MLNTLSKRINIEYQKLDEYYDNSFFELVRCLCIAHPTSASHKTKNNKVLVSDFAL